MSADDKTRLFPGHVPTRAGTQLSGVYELDDLLGVGGMGEVYRGHNIQTGDLVAIKIVRPEFARDQMILSLFRKEASILNHLSHEAIVRYHVFTIDPGIARPYLAMEFVDGDSLCDVMRSGPMAADDVRRLCHRLATGLHAVHQAGAIHRDLSPDNIILPGGRVERAKIIDFGIARSSGIGGETLIGERFAGKYNYVSPEQLGLYGGEVTERSDIYGLGLVLAAALRGKPLDMGGSQLEVVEKRRVVPDLSGVNVEMRAVLEAMLQPDPLDRLSSMAEIAWMTRTGSQIESDQERSGRPGGLAGAQPSPAPQRGSAVPPSAHGGSRFVEHLRPAHLSRPASASKLSPPVNESVSDLKKIKIGRTLAIASLPALVSVVGLAAFLRGDPLPWSEPSEPIPGGISHLKPNPADPASEESAAKESQEGTPSGAPHRPPDNASAESKMDASASAVPPPAATAADAPQVGTSSPHVQTAEQILDSLIRQSETGEDHRPTDDRPEVARELTATETSLPETAVAEPESIPSPAPSVQTGTSAEPNPSVKAARAQGADEARVPEPKTGTGVRTEPVSPDSGGPSPPPGTQSNETSDPAHAPPKDGRDIEPQGDAVVINRPGLDGPKKEARVPIADVAAQYAAWIRQFPGGDCFFASPTALTETAIQVEGFAAAVDPFEVMLETFTGRFGVEPNVEVRLIEAAQCAMPRFMKGLPATSAPPLDLSLDQMSIPSGGTLSGTLRISSDQKVSLLLIDHAGIVFSLDQALMVDGGLATFSVPITLDAGENLAGKPLPQVLVAIAGTSHLQAADLSEPTPASVLLPRLLSEIEEAGSDFSTIAKYFQIGG